MVRLVIYNNGTHLRNETGVHVFVVGVDGEEPTMLNHGDELELSYSVEDEVIVDIQVPVP